MGVGYVHACYMPIFETYEFIVLRGYNSLIFYCYNQLYSYIFTIDMSRIAHIYIPADGAFVYFKLLFQHPLAQLSIAHVCSVFNALIRFTTLTISASGRFYRWPRLHKERTHRRSDFFIGDAHLTHHIFFYKYNVRLVRRKFYTSHFVRFSRRRIRLVTFDFNTLAQYANNIIQLQPANIFTNRGLIIHGLLRRQKKGKIEKFY